MSYRLYTKPLTEKTINKPLDSELIVNTSNGHISVTNSDGKFSATKNIDAEISLQKFLVTQIKSIIADLEVKIAKIKVDYTEVQNKLNGYDSRLKVLEDIIANLKKLMDKIESFTAEDSYLLWYYYGFIWKVLPEFADKIVNATAVQRKIDEVKYIAGKLPEMKTTVESHLDEAHAFHADVKINVNSRVDKSTYDNWVADYVKRTLALKSYSTKVSKVTFKHKI